ncbi:amidase [Salinispira pacifica]
MNDVRFLPASELARLIKDRKVRALDALEIQLEHIRLHNPRFNALVTIDEQNARVRAREADAALEAGEDWGPLHGVAVTLKDTFETAGLRTTSGTASFAEHVPERDAPAVERLRSAGAIILGKSNTAALADGAQTANRVFGRTGNPWDPERTPGGSSGGSAAAVAAGFSALDIGSDIAGSIRMPAHFCGVYGLKPTGGRIPIQGHIASEHAVALPDELLWMLLVPCAGPIARSVEDLALALRVMADPLSSALTRRRETPSGPPRIAWTDSLPGVPVSEDTRRLIGRAAERLADAGFTVDRAETPGIDIAEAWELAGEVIGYLNTRFQPALVRTFRLLASRGASALARRQGLLRGLVRGPGLSRAKLRALADRREALIRQIDTFLGDWDSWIGPVYPTAAFTHRDRRASIEVAGRSINQDLAEISCNVVFNTSGHPAVVLPAGVGNEGLPIGFQMIGRRWEDEELLELATRVDGLVRGYEPPPDIATGRSH